MTSALFVRSSAEERKSTPLLSIISALFCEKVGVGTKFRVASLQSKILTVNNQYDFASGIPRVMHPSAQPLARRSTISGCWASPFLAPSLQRNRSPWATAEVAPLFIHKAETRKRSLRYHS